MGNFFVKENPGGGVNIVLNNLPKRLPRKLKKRYCKPNKWSRRYERLMASGKFWRRELVNCQIVDSQDPANQDLFSLEDTNISINIQYDYQIN